jgi:hypothetical protein
MRVRHFTTLIAVLLGAAVATAAQSTISLEGGAGQGVTFTTGGSAGVNLNLGTCILPGACSLYGLATGSGSLQSLGMFALTSSAGAVDLTAATGGGFTASASSPAQFALYGIDQAANEGGLLLAGTLDLTGLTTANGGGTEATLAGNLEVTAGLLANALTSASVPMQLNLHFPTGAGLGALVGLNGSLSALFTGGSVGSVSATPEPAALVLMGLGALLLIGCAAASKRRWAEA